MTGKRHIYPLKVKEQLLKNLDKYIEDTYFYQDLPGLVVSVKHGEMIYRRALGYADFPAGRQMELADVFRCVSVAKLFTATAATTGLPRHYGYVRRLIFI